MDRTKDGKMLVSLAHGAGGLQSQEIVREIFVKRFSNVIIDRMEDSAVVDLPCDLHGSSLAFTTDSFVVSPVFFKGGDIGKLAVCGTVNDLCCVGAVPLYLTMGFIIEEGFCMASLDRIAESVAITAESCGVTVVAGDTKVVPAKAADGIFINSSGIGVVRPGVHISCANARPGDNVIVSGGIGEHGCAIILSRDDLGLESEIVSDCAPLNGMIGMVADTVMCDSAIHTIRDITRGGLAAVLNEISGQSGTGMRVFENKVPLRDDVSAVCGILGLDPLNLACEGRVVMVVSQNSTDAVLKALRGHEYGRGAQVVGVVTDDRRGRVLLRTSAGGDRIVDMPSGEQLPRIC